MGVLSGLFRRKPAEEPAKPQLAIDSAWVSPAGHGTSVDKSMRGRFAVEDISWADLASLYDHDGLTARAVGLIVDDALRQGYTLRFGGDTDPEQAQAARDELRKWDEDHRFTAEIKKHLTQTRLFGGAALVQIGNADQTQIYSARRDPEVGFLTFTPREIYGLKFDLDPLSPSYNLPLSWKLGADANRPFIEQSWVYASRTERIASTLSAGKDTWTGPSKLSGFYQELRAWGISMQAATSALQELSRLIYKINGAQTLAGAPEASRNLVRDRIREIQECGSMMQPTVLDLSEALERNSISLGGMGDVLGHIMIALCASVGCPVTSLFGVSPGGFGTGEGEKRIWDDSVRAYQRLVVRPLLRWALTRVFESGAVSVPSGKWSIEFPPLATATETESTLLRNQQALTDNIYLTHGVLSPNEVAQSRFGGSEWSMETTLDLEERAMAERDDDTEEDLDEQEQEILNAASSATETDDGDERP